MTMIINNRRKKQAGFTLVELLVVVAIIAVLSAVLVPQLIRYVTTARVNRTMGDLASIRSILEAYATTDGKGSYPNIDSVAGGDAFLGAVMTEAGIDWGGAGTGILDPWDRTYVYVVSATFNGYIVASAGPSGLWGTGDDIYVTHKASPVQGDSSAAALSPSVPVDASDALLGIDGTDFLLSRP